MSDSQLNALIEDFFHKTLKELEEERLMGVGVPKKDSEWSTDLTSRMTLLMMWSISMTTG